jgi:ethanolamine utilization protein EutN
MLIGKVTGSVVSSVKDERLTASKLLLVSPAGVNGETGTGSPLVAVDLVGAGADELVLVVRGTPAAFAVGDGHAPVDAAIVGIVDTVRTSSGSGYKKE